MKIFPWDDEENKPVGENLQYELWLDKQKVMPLDGFLRLDDSLRESRNNGLEVYDSGGIYWNSEGARIAAQAILDFIFPNSQGITLENNILTKKILSIRNNTKGLIHITEEEGPI